MMRRLFGLSWLPLRRRVADLEGESTRLRLGCHAADCNDLGVTHPGPFLFKVGTEQELQDAIDNGLTETHYLDFKRELGLNERARKDLAVDVAASEP